MEAFFAIDIFLEQRIFSPDRNGNPFENKGYFFLFLQNDQRKFLLKFRKKAIVEKDCNG
jgi:hypothetical protein